MKIAFVTDMHFGYRRFEQDAFQQGREAILSAARQADLIILGGDNFDTPLPRMETLAQVTDILREALGIMHSRGAVGVPIVAIHGNHDRRPKGFVHPTELLARGGFVQSAHNRTIVFEKDGQKVAVSGMGSVPEDLAVSAMESLSCAPVQGAFNIFVLHQTFQEHEKIPHENYLSNDDLPEGFDLYLCGHVHQPNLGGRVLNPGSTVVTQLRADEAGQRGWLLYDTQNKQGKFMPIASRQLYRVVLPFQGATPEQIRAAVEGEVQKIRQASPGCLLKIVITGTLANGFASSDLRLPQQADDVFVENAINAESLQERIGQIKFAREKKTTSREQGMQLLTEKLKGTAYSLGDPEKLFEKLLAGHALDEIKEGIEKKPNAS